MKSIRSKILETRFAPETQFVVVPVVTALRRGEPEAGLEELKARMLACWTADSSPAVADCLGWAAQEAAALAWSTPFPLLMFPVLFEEKAQAALEKLARQRAIRVNTSRLLLDAARAGVRVIANQGRHLKPALNTPLTVLSALQRKIEQVQTETGEFLSQAGATEPLRETGV